MPHRVGSTKLCTELGQSVLIPRFGLARYFGTSERFWLNLQARYDLEAERDRLGPGLLKEVAVL